MLRFGHGMDRDRPGQRKFLLLSLKIEETNLDSDISDNEFSIVKWSRMFWKRRRWGWGAIPYPTTDPTKAPPATSPTERRAQTTGAAARGVGDAPPSEGLVPSAPSSSPFSLFADISSNELVDRGRWT
jgi:hypothetical protein